MRLTTYGEKVNQEIGFYTKETFANVPPTPGVYAMVLPVTNHNNKH